jgi:hypothetical protein
MEQNRLNQNPQPPMGPRRAGARPRPGVPMRDVIGGINRPLPVVPRAPVVPTKPSAAPSQHKQYHRPVQAASTPQGRHAPQPKAEVSTLSIKLRIPPFKVPNLPPLLKEYKGFWLLLAILGLLLFTIGYQMGHSHTKTISVPPPAAFAPSVTKGQVS